MYPNLVRRTEVVYKAFALKFIELRKYQNKVTYALRKTAYVQLHIEKNNNVKIMKKEIKWIIND